MPDVLILTGPPGSGKSSVAEALAERYDRVVRLPVDAVHEFITPTGHVHPWGSPDAWARQHALLIRAICASAREFLSERFAVVIEDTAVSAGDLKLYLDGLQAAGLPVHFVRLLPSLGVCLARNAARGAEERMSPQRVEAAYNDVLRAGEAAGAMIDSSALSVYETADRVQALTTSGESLVWAPASA